MEEKERCHQTVYKAESSWSGKRVQCKRAAVEDGFCRQHHPDRNAEKQAKWNAEWIAKKAAIAKQSAISTCERAVLDAADRWRDRPATNPNMELAVKVDALRKAREI